MYTVITFLHAVIYIDWLYFTFSKDPYSQKIISISSSKAGTSLFLPDGRKRVSDNPSAHVDYP